MKTNPWKWPAVLTIATLIGGSLNSIASGVPTARQRAVAPLAAAAINLPSPLLAAAAVVTAVALVVTSEGTTLTATPAEAALTQIAAGATATTGDDAHRAALNDSSIVLLSSNQVAQISKTNFDN